MWRRTGIIVALLFVVSVVGGLGFLKRILTAGKNEHTGSGTSTSIGDTIKQATDLAFNPSAGFPGQDRINILCMGIDDNWTDTDQVYTKDARTDTLFILSLDLINHKISMLSIPRDTYAHIAGTNHSFKINSAYQTGGPERAVQTVQELLGVHADHYMVLNIDATKKMVDALGGVDVNVENEMHYHDAWGHLSIDLMPGEQHLDGAQAVGFARYRHPDAGKKGSPEDGDDRRMYRQHVLLKGMIGKAKNLANVTQAPHLIDVGMSSIRTDLTRGQLYDLAAIFKGVQPDDIKTASIPGEDFRGPDGAWFFRPDAPKSSAYVDWLIKGDETAIRRLTPIVVKNGTDINGLAQRAVRQLIAYGYTDVRNGGTTRKIAAPVVPAGTPESETSMTGTATPPVTATAKPAVYEVTELLDSGVPSPDVVRDILTGMQMMNAQVLRRPNKPNHLGWTPPVNVTVVLGKDYADANPEAAPDAGTTTGETGSSSE
ncbi:MAG: cell envelope-related transcriptional attenuator [Capsulimonas sp.]|jgi:LCP family protein required for cell wall assembly|nr:cell envelope-related transcriptional attenuator [Capsulimonas sp.]